MVVSYTSNYSPINRYSVGENQFTTNADGGGNGDSGFLKAFEETESEESKKSKESGAVDYLEPNYSDYYASEHVVRDYIDNSLLLNTEQVACTNIAQHLALKSSVKDTLYFLNTQAAKTMVNSRKRNYNFQSKPIEQVVGTADVNFFKTSSLNNFFITK